MLDALITAYLYDGLTRYQIVEELAEQDGIRVSYQVLCKRIRRLPRDVRMVDYERRQQTRRENTAARHNHRAAAMLSRAL